MARLTATSFEQPGSCHCHAVQAIGDFHGALVVGNHDELRTICHLAHKLVVPIDVHVIEWGIDLIEQAEGRRLHLEDGEDKSYRCERLLSPGELIDRAVLLARRLRHDFDAGLEKIDIVASGERDPSSSTAEQPREDLLELLVDRVKRLPEKAPRRPVYLRDGFFRAGQPHW